MKIDLYHIQTCLGKITPFRDQLNFLTKDEIEEFNKIGYTGKNSKGERTYYKKYLNSLNKGQFEMEQTRYDDGDWTEEFTVIRITI